MTHTFGGLLLLLASGVVWGCSFTTAPLPNVAAAEKRRAWDAIVPVSEASYLAHLKQSFYRTWIAEYGVTSLPPTLDPSRLKQSDFETSQTAGAAMAAAEGRVSALELLDLTSERLQALQALSSTPRDAAAFRDVVWGYQSLLQRRLARVGERVSAAAERPDVHFVLEPGLGLNAGVPKVVDADTVLVGPPLLLLLDSDDELAAVLGHEVAHIVEGHAQAAATREGAIDVLQAVAMVVVAVAAVSTYSEPMDEYDVRLVTQLASAAGGLTGGAARGAVLVSGYPRDNERDADYYGLQYAARAGYDPAGALSAFAKIAGVSKGLGGSSELPILADHPDIDERIVRLTKAVGRIRSESGDFSAGGLHCWHAPAGEGQCRICCTTTSYCVNECDP